MKLMYKVLYEGDPAVTRVFDVNFTADEAIEMPEGREWLYEKLKDNPWFIDPDVTPHPEPVEAQPREPIVN